jgi:hypothetical protein
MFDPVERMLTTSRNPTVRHPPFNQFRPSGQSNFISEELFHQENNFYSAVHRHRLIGPIITIIKQKQITTNNIHTIIKQALQRYTKLRGTTLSL